MPRIITYDSDSVLDNDDKFIIDNSTRGVRTINAEDLIPGLKNVTPVATDISYDSTNHKLTRSYNGQTAGDLITAEQMFDCVNTYPVKSKWKNLVHSGNPDKVEGTARYMVSGRHMYINCYVYVKQNLSKNNWHTILQVHYQYIQDFVDTLWEDWTFADDSLDTFALAASELTYYLSSVSACMTMINDSNVHHAEILIWSPDPIPEGAYIAITGHIAI